MIPCDKKYTLPTISFVGGATKIYDFKVHDSVGDEVEVENCRARFSVVSAVNRSGSPVVTKELSIVTVGETKYLRLVLNPEDTLDLQGKYIYQVWVIALDDTAEEAQQGELYIKQNIDKSYLTMN